MRSSLQGRDTDAIVRGRGDVLCLEICGRHVSVLTAKLTADGQRSCARATAEFGEKRAHRRARAVPSWRAARVTTRAFQIGRPAITRLSCRWWNNTVNLRVDPDTRAPRTDEYSIGVDREIGRRLATSIAYVHKEGPNFIGWTNVGGQ